VVTKNLWTYSRRQYCGVVDAFSLKNRHAAVKLGVTIIRGILSAEILQDRKGGKQAKTLDFISYHASVLQFQNRVAVGFGSSLQFCKEEPMDDPPILDLSQVQLEAMDDRSRLQVLDL